MKSFAWEENFPPVFNHTSISFLKRCPGFYQAKNGDLQAAFGVVDACVKDSRIIEIREKYPDALLVPVASKNKIPQAFAQAIGLEVYDGVRAACTGNRKSMPYIERLVNKPCFTGRITEGQKYIIVDDVISSGGTVSALRRHILDCGGAVCAVAALAHSANNGDLAPSIEIINRFKQQFAFRRICKLLKAQCISDDLRELTYPEIKYLLRFKKTERIESALNRLKR